MSIVTKKGDGGQTALRYGRPVPKTSLRVEAYGTIDELGSHLGFAKALIREKSTSIACAELLQTIQSQLLCVGADLATSAQDHLDKNKPQYNEAFLGWIESEVQKLEKIVKMDGFILPGANVASAAIHVARTVSRRAERCVLHLLESEDDPAVRKLLPYLNRLSDFLWLLGEKFAQE